MTVDRWETLTTITIRRNRVSGHHEALLPGGGVLGSPTLHGLMAYVADDIEWKQGCDDR